MNKTKNHYVVVELKWFDSFVTVYDSSHSSQNGKGNLRNVFVKYLDVPALERVFPQFPCRPGKCAVGRCGENLARDPPSISS